jgi:hypothetical protein
MRFKEFMTEGLADMFASKPKVDWNKRAKELFAKGMDEQQVRAQLLKEGCPPKQVDVYVQGGQLEESATAGATSAANIGTVVNPHISPGKARGKKSYTGSPGKSGTKSPAQPKIVQRTNKNGTAKGAHELKGVSLFGGPALKR